MTKKLHIPDKIKILNELGYTKERIQELYDSGRSKNDLIREINSKYDSETLLSRTSFLAIWNQWGLVARSKQETNDLRMKKINDKQRANFQNLPKYGRGITADEAVAYYKSGLSLTQVYKQYGISPVILSRILKERGIEVRQQHTASEIIQRMLSQGLDKIQMERLYNDDNLTFDELKSNVENRIGITISGKTFEKVRVRMGVVKTEENKVINRGRKSREEFQHNLDRLLKTPYKSLQEVADHYYEKKSLTYHDLVRELNSFLDTGDEGFSLRWVNRWITPLLPPDREIGTSRLERSVISFIRSVYSGKIRERDRTVIPPYELDVYLPELHMAVEVNGVYWHSEAFGRGRNYHLTKYELCKRAGVRLIQVWEDDWNDRRPIVESLLAHRFGVDQGERIGARKTYVAVVGNDIAEVFMNEHHIQGFTNTSLHLGLFQKDDDELVAVMSVVGKENGACEIVRYATSQTVQGGFSKLLKHFESLWNPTTIKTFSNREISEGRLYDETGFVIDGVVPPDYSYVFGERRQHKFNFRKSRFKSRPDLLYREGYTENELAELNGLYKVWDTGKIRWTRRCRVPEDDLSLENEIQELPQCSTRFKETDHEIPRQS